MGLFEDGARAGKAETDFVEGHGGWDFGGHGRVRGWAERAPEMADVAAHEDECCGGSAREAGDVAYGVAGDIEDVEAAVAEEVMGGVLTDFRGGLERYLVDCATSVDF